MVNIRDVSISRRLKKVNQSLVNDYEDYLDEVLGSGTTPEPTNLTDKYKDIMMPLLLSLFTSSAQAQNNIQYQREVYNLAEQKAIEYIDHVDNIITDAYKRLEYVSVEQYAYDELRKSGADILTTLNVADKDHAYPYTEISPALIRNSLDNRIAMTESLADYTYFTNILDYNGDFLYTDKAWLWSEAENTRHSEMDGQTVPIDEMFVVVNEVTGNEDLGLFPRDYDNLSPENSYNCLCDIKYLVQR